MAADSVISGMPYYRITIWMNDQPKPATGIRESTIQDINRAWQYYENKAKESYPARRIKRFELVMLSKHSPEVMAYIQQKKKPPID